MAGTKLSKKDEAALESAAEWALIALYNAQGTDDEDWQRGYFAAIDVVCEFFGVEHEKFNPLHNL